MSGLELLLLLHIGHSTRNELKFIDPFDSITSNHSFNKAYTMHSVNYVMEKKETNLMNQ